jgi:hypothetical protein
MDMITTRLAALAATAALALGAVATAGPALASPQVPSGSPSAGPSCSSQIRYWTHHQGYGRLRALDLYTAHLLDLYTQAPPTVAQTRHLLGLSRASRQIPPPGCLVDNGYYWVIGRDVYAAYSDARQGQSRAAEGDVQAADRNEVALAGQVHTLYRFHGRFPSPPDSAR